MDDRGVIDTGGRRLTLDAASADEVDTAKAAVDPVQAALDREAWHTRTRRVIDLSALPAPLVAKLETSRRLGARDAAARVDPPTPLAAPAPVRWRIRRRQDRPAVDAAAGASRTDPTRPQSLDLSEVERRLVERHTHEVRPISARADWLGKVRRPHITVDYPEVVLDWIASSIVRQIRSERSWDDPRLAHHHALFDPLAERREIGRHADSIARLRWRALSIDPDSQPEPLRQGARDRQSSELRTIDVLADSLARRVAALWLYHHSLEQLSLRILEFEAIEASLARESEAIDLARQLGADEIAIDRLTALQEDSESLARQVAILREIADRSLSAGG
ncbi:hypothetical protein [Tsukamurella soli]|uniref:Uncharacterized protein n=1 Tax=Tsukamurella soli TaxID=644556 RepID=A0ABP8J0H7_9ACTN